MARIVGAWAICLLAWQTAPAAELKLKKVSLFTSGVGCFEAAATIDGTATAELRFRADQINDILKSLVLHDLDGGSFSAVEYPSLQPTDKTLRTFGVDITGHPSLAQLLEQLRGVRVEVKTPNPTTGLIVNVEKKKTTTRQGEIIAEVLLNLLTEDGLRTFTLAQLSGIRFLDPKIESELRKALTTLAATHDTDKKSIVLHFEGEGRRRVRVDYLLETPVWKTTYRLVLGEDGKAFLQGWAIVENATEEDWQDVQLNLVSGRPISFEMDLYRSLYMQRPVEKMAMYESLRPHEYEGGLGGGRFVARKGKPDDRIATGGLAGGGGRRRAGKRLASARISLLDAEGEKDRDGLYDARIRSLAEAGEAGELFQYTIKTPVSLKRQHSAMLPIVAAEVRAEKLSIYNPATHPRHPLNGVRMKNATGLQLMQGPVTLFDGNVYAGDAKLPDLRIDDDRLIAYALDLGVAVSVKQERAPEQVTEVWIGKGAIWQRSKLVDLRIYTLRNKDHEDRTVLVEQAIGSGWELVAPESPEEKTASGARFKVALPAKKTRTLSVLLEQQQENGVILSTMAQEHLALRLRSKVISKAVREALNRLMELRAALDETTQAIASRETNLEEITKEQDRIRRNMEVLDRQRDLYQRYERKFDKQETEIERIREEVAALRTKAQGQQRAIEEYVRSLAVK
ncbi:MAG: hypothetical protein ACE5E1_00865 [Phycisphaerae bacterium]